MVLKKLVSCICNFIIPGGQPRSKEASSYEVITSDVLENFGEGSSSCPPGSCLAEDFECEFCCVCLSTLEEGEDMRVLPCLHKFHRTCINRWFSVCTRTCPICRFSLDKEEKFQFRAELTEEMVIWFSSFHVAGF